MGWVFLKKGKKKTNPDISSKITSQFLFTILEKFTGQVYL